MHRSGEKRARGVRGCEWSMRAGNRPLAARLPAHLLPLTQGSPLCGSRMCPWLRCVDLLAVAACSTPRFYSERAKSPAWTFLPSPLPPLAPSRASAPAHTPAKLCIPSPIPSSPPPPPDSYFTPGSTVLAIPIAYIISLVDGNRVETRPLEE